MPLPKDFLHHLHEVMVEVSDSLREDEAAYKARLLGEARRKNNSAAVLLAYREASLHSYQTKKLKNDRPIFRCTQRLETGLD
jgi:hypothetical protein